MEFFYFDTTKGNIQSFATDIYFQRYQHKRLDIQCLGSVQFKYEWQQENTYFNLNRLFFKCRQQW